MIENHAGELIQSLVGKLKTDPHTASYRQLSDGEIGNRTSAVYRNLGAWMEEKPQEMVRSHYSELGRARYEENIPLSEVVYALVLTKTSLLDYVRANGLADGMLEIYAAQELLTTVSHFFDHAIYYTVLGYEKALAQGKPAVANSEPAKAIEATSADLARFCP
jgi:Histidine kinase N terminal